MTIHRYFENLLHPLLVCTECKGYKVMEYGHMPAVDLNPENGDKPYNGPEPTVSIEKCRTCHGSGKLTVKEH